MRSLLLVWAVLGSTLVAQPPTLDPDARQRIADVLGVTDPLVTLARLAADAPADREAARRALDSLRDRDPAGAVQLALAGLWSEDPAVALGACSRLTFDQLDRADSVRYVEVGLADLFKPNPVTDFSDYRYVLDSASVDRLFDELPPRDRDVFNILQQIHRNMRAAHLPLLCRLMTCDQSLLRHEALDTLKVLTWYTDQHRDPVGRALLRWNDSVVVAPDEERPDNYQPRELDLPESSAGYPAVLTAVLERLFLEPVLDSNMAAMRGWARRWALDATADATDRDLLVALANEKLPLARWIGVQGMADLRDPDTTALLLEIAAGAEEDPLVTAYALAALSERGDRQARERLAQAADSDPAALALWLGSGGNAALEEFCAAACGRDVEHGSRLLDRLSLAIEDRPVYGVALPRELGPALERAAFAAEPKLEARRLGRLVREFPECRSERLLRRYLESIGPADMATFHPEFCEVAWPDALIAALRGLAANPDSADRATELLARLGDPGSAKSIIQWFETSERRDWFELARTRATPIRERLAGAARQIELPEAAAIPDRWFAPLIALAAHDGLPEATARSWSDALEGLPTAALAADFAAWRQPIFEGSPTDALDAFLAAAPDEVAPFDGLGLVRSDGVRRFLEGRRDRRELGDCVDAIGQLAVMGEPQAIAEMRAATAAGHYGWVDSSTSRALTLGFDSATLPFWIDELESNCCRNVPAAIAIEDFLGLDVFGIPDGGAITRAAWCRDLVERIGPNLRYSRLAGHWIGVTAP